MMPRSFAHSTFAALLIAVAGAGCVPAGAEGAADLDENEGETLESEVGAKATVQLGADGKLVYKADSRGDRIPDFSYAGYQGGGVEIPKVPVVRTLSASSGDNRKKLQDAIDEVAALPRAKRGAILLKKGTYRLSGPIYVKASGIVLRGEGEGANGTVLLSTLKSKREEALVQLAGKAPERVGTARKVADEYVPVGARKLRLESTSGLAVGDMVLVDRPSTKAWIHELGMDQIPPRKDGKPIKQWEPEERHLSFDRRITAIDGKVITLDAPITNSLDPKYGGGKVQKYEGHTIAEVGVENLRGDTVFDGSTDEDHIWDFVSFTNVRNGWAQHVTGVHFAHRVVGVLDGSRQITVRKSTSLSPVSKVEGGRRYAFHIDGGQLVLVHDCSSEKGRHDYVTGSRVAGPNVFLESVAKSPGAEVGPHERWAVGTLYDNIVVQGGDLSAYDRGNMGSGHGWAGANHVFWNSSAEGMTCEQPPTAHNWNFGADVDDRTGNCEWRSVGKDVKPESLYRQQLRERLGAKAMKALDAE